MQGAFSKKNPLSRIAEVGAIFVSFLLISRKIFSLILLFFAIFQAFFVDFLLLFYLFSCKCLILYDL